MTANNKKGYVYLLGNNDHYFKIGVTTGSIQNRIKKLQTGNPEPIHLVNSFETDFPFYIEKRMHAKYMAQNTSNEGNTSNEWFSLTSDNVTNFNKDCQFFESIVLSLKDNPFINAN